MVSPRRLTTVLLALLIGFTPLSPLMLIAPLAPVTQAKADTVDELKQCLNTVSDVLDGAGSVADAVKDPEYLACTAEAGSGDVLDIAFMAAMTAFYAVKTAQGSSPFDDPASCKTAIQQTVLGNLAQQLKGLLTGAFGDVLKSLVGQSGVDLITQVADATDAGGPLDGAILDAETALWTALGPVTHYLDCGCAVAGTVAIVKDTGVSVAHDASACGDILKDPGALIDAVFSDPVGVAKAALSAACEATLVCPAARFVAGLPGDVVTFLKGAHGADCGDCNDPGLSPPACPGDGSFTAAVNVSYTDGTTGIDFNNSCVCQPPFGRTTEYNSAADQYGSTCGSCGPYSGRDQDGFCHRCSLPYKQGADGRCDLLYTCPDGERYGPDGACFGCGLFAQFDPSGQTCWPICKGPVYPDDPHLINDPQSGACICQAGMVDIHDGKDCVDRVVCLAAGEQPDPQTNTCVTICTGQLVLRTDRASATSSCKPCDAGTHKEGEACVIDFVPVVCTGTNEIRTGSNTCMTCPDGTVPGFNGCESPCAPGSQPRKAQTTAEFVNSGLTKFGNTGLASFGAGAQAALYGLGAGGGANVPGSPGFTPADRKAYDTAHPAKGDNQCVQCGKNEYSETTTLTFPANSTGTGGFTISTTVCAVCPTGMVSGPGSASCHLPFTLEVSRGPTAVRIPASYTPPTEKELVPSQPLIGKPLPVKPKACPRGEIQQKDGSCQVAKTSKEPATTSGDKLQKLLPTNQGNPTSETLKPETGGQKYRPTLGTGIGVLTAKPGPGVQKPSLTATPGPGVVTPSLHATPGPGVVTTPPRYKP